MKDENIKKILNDLYALDPSLRNREKELVTLINAMAIKPEAHYDPAFAAILRAKLLAELAAIPPQKRTLSDIFMGQPARYAATAIAVIAIAIIAVTTLHPKNGAGGTLALNTVTPSITSVGPDAFGALNELSSTGTASNASAGSSNSAASPTTAGAPMAEPMSAIAPTASNVSGQAVIARPILPPNLTTIKYNYTGATFSQNESSLDVLKKITAPFNASQATAALEQAGFGPMDLSSFSGLTMNDVTLSQNQSFGYDISIDFTDGTMSIDQDYNEWPQGNTTPLTSAEIPSNSAVIATANQFLSAHSIATTSYGQPQVSPTSIIVPVATPVNEPTPPTAENIGASASAGGSAAMPMIPYYSDSEQVLYPLMVNGQNVYDTNGNAIGMTVTVNVRYNRVSDVDGIDAESYQSSAYGAITSTSTILSMAETAPTYPIIYNDAIEGSANGDAANGSASAKGTNSTVTTVDLGTPTMAYEDMYQTDGNGDSSEFLVPAFAFPVVGAASDAQPQIIMVPLISEFAQQQTNNIVRVVPVMTPSIQDSNGPGSATSSPAK